MVIICNFATPTQQIQNDHSVTKGIKPSVIRCGRMYL